MCLSPHLESVTVPVRVTVFFLGLVCGLREAARNSASASPKVTRAGMWEKTFISFLFVSCSTSSNGHSTRKTTPGMPVENKVESGLIDCMLNGTRIVLCDMVPDQETHLVHSLKP